MKETRKIVLATMLKQTKMQAMPSSWRESLIEVSPCLRMKRTQLMVAEVLAAAVVAMPMVMRLLSNVRVAGPVATHLCRCGRVRVIWHANLKMIQTIIRETHNGWQKSYLFD